MSILIVDDDTDGREAVGQYLTKAGFTVRSAPSGRAALISLATGVPDAVILDLMMPEMNGVEFLRIIRSYLGWSTLPVIVLTAYPEGEHIQKVREMGVQRIFTKANLKFDDLVQCINSLRQGADTAGAG
jgi:DNA-binding response OmpR family regulator